MTINIHKQFGDARKLGAKVHFLTIRYSRLCYVQGFDWRNGSWSLVMGGLVVQWSRVL